jgi:hypothetical protein
VALYLMPIAATTDKKSETSPSVFCCSEGMLQHDHVVVRFDDLINRFPFEIDVDQVEPVFDLVEKASPLLCWRCVITVR